MAQIKADEITKLIREQIENYQQTMAVEEVGSVISVGDGIARIHGLDKCMAGEMLEFTHGVYGIALNLEEDQVGAVLLGDYAEIEEGDVVKRTGKIMSVPVGDALVGRVVNPLGQPLDEARFRANIVLETSNGSTERDWLGGTLVFGEGEAAPRLRVNRPIPRCRMITIDPATGVKDPRILETVAAEFGNEIGVYCAPDGIGTLRLGDPVRLMR
jgi:hypothetical protein